MKIFDKTNSNNKNSVNKSLIDVINTKGEDFNKSYLISKLKEFNIEFNPNSTRKILIDKYNSLVKSLQTIDKNIVTKENNLKDIIYNYNVTGLVNKNLNHIKDKTLREAILEKKLILPNQEIINSNQKKIVTKDSFSIDADEKVLKSTYFIKHGKIYRNSVINDKTSNKLSVSGNEINNSVLNLNKSLLFNNENFADCINNSLKNKTIINKDNTNNTSNIIFNSDIKNYINSVDNKDNNIKLKNTYKIETINITIGKENVKQNSVINAFNSEFNNEKIKKIFFKSENKDNDEFNKLKNPFTENVQNLLKPNFNITNNNIKINTKNFNCPYDNNNTLMHKINYKNDSTQNLNTCKKTNNKKEFDLIKIYDNYDINDMKLSNYRNSIVFNSINLKDKDNIEYNNLESNKLKGTNIDFSFIKNQNYDCLLEYNKKKFIADNNDIQVNTAITDNNINNFFKLNQFIPNSKGSYINVLNNDTKYKNKSFSYYIQQLLNNKTFISLIKQQNISISFLNKVGNMFLLIITYLSLDYIYSKIIFNNYFYKDKSFCFFSKSNIVKSAWILIIIVTILLTYTFYITLYNLLVQKCQNINKSSGYTNSTNALSSEYSNDILNIFNTENRLYNQDLQNGNSINLINNNSNSKSKQYDDIEIINEENFSKESSYNNI